MQGQTCAASCCVTVHVSITDALRHVSTTLCAATPVLRYAPLHPARKSSSVFFTTQVHHNETSPSSLHLSIRILPRHARQLSCHSTNFVFSAHAKDPTGRLTTLRGLIRRDHLEIFSAGNTPPWRPVGVSKMTRVRRSHSNRSDNIDTPVAHNLSCPRQPTESGIIYVYI